LTLNLTRFSPLLGNESVVDRTLADAREKKPKKTILESEKKLTTRSVESTSSFLNLHRDPFELLHLTSMSRSTLLLLHFSPLPLLRVRELFNDEMKFLLIHSSAVCSHREPEVPGRFRSKSKQSLNFLTAFEKAKLLQFAGFGRATERNFLFLICVGDLLRMNRSR
jgi:hypothetical protein